MSYKGGSQGVDPFSETNSSGEPSSANDFAIEIADLSKCYHVYGKPRDRLFQMLAGRKKKYYKEFWALRGLSFKVKRGETVGIIGKNGAGKSTLLQLICGTLNPTAGQISINGRVAALLELGAGFNPDFTGRENVYMAASLYGLSPTDIDRKFDAICAFADIGEFIDQPVKTYSSGMYVRLAFAVIAHVDADILIIDEALAVGDAFFQQKCMRLLREFQDSGGTILFVSHDISSVTGLCQNALYLSAAGSGRYSYGPAELICKEYLNSIYQQKATDVLLDVSSSPERLAAHNVLKPADKWVEHEGESVEPNLIRVAPFRKNAEGFGDGQGEIFDVWFEDANGVKIDFVNGGDAVVLVIEARSHREVKLPAIGFMLKDRLGQYVVAESTDVFFRDTRPKLEQGDLLRARFSFKMPELIAGEYTMNFAFANGIGDEHVQLHWLYDALQLTVIKSRLVHGICGLIDLTVRMDVVRDNAEPSNV